MNLPTFSKFWPTTRRSVLLVLIQLIAYMPLLVSFTVTDTAEAFNATATTPATTKDDVAARCSVLGSANESLADLKYNSAVAAQDPNLSDEDKAAVAGDLENAEDDPYSSMVYVGPSDISPLYPADTASQLANIGAADSGGWWVCGLDAQRLLSPVPISGKLNAVMNAAINVSSSITFKNPTDYYAVGGEPCSKWNGSVCDETKVKVNDKGDKTYQDDPNCQLSAKDGWTPVNYQDVGWENNCWDAPKADARILKALTYLITPKDQGGAGHETIEVGKVLQVSGKDAEFGSDDAKSPRPECGAGTYSSHTYLATPAHGSSCVSKAVEIDKIDNIRVTTKITEKKRVGSDKVSYQYQQFPIKVAWQTDQGIQQSGGLPATNLYSGALLAFQGGFDQFLSNLDLEPSLDISGITVNNFGDLLKVAGSSLLGSLLNSPSGALKGDGLSSTLDSFGKEYLAQQIGLVPGALNNTNGDLVAGVGQATLESMLKLPSDSLKGSTPDQILANVGQRYLEQDVFKVTPGTLSASDGFSISSAADLARAIGIGKIEQTYNLAPQSLRVSSLDKLISSSTSAKQTFTTANVKQVDNDLYLSYVPQSGATIFGVPTSAADYDNPTAKLLSGAISPSAYFQLVGTRSIQGGIGAFTATSTNNDSVEPLRPVSPIFGGAPKTSINGVDCTNVLSQFKDSNPFEVCSDRNLFTILTANNNDGLQSLVDSGVFTQAQANDFLARVQQTLLSNTFHLAPNQSQGDRIVTLKNLYNQITDPAASGWQTILQTALQKLSTGRNAGLSDDTYRAKPRTDVAEDTLNQAISLLHQFTEGILDYYDKIGQGGMGAGLYLSSTRVTFTPQGQIAEVKTGSSDPIESLLKGNVSGLTQIGRQVAAQALTTDKTAQHSLFNQVNPDGSAYRNDFASTGVAAQQATNNLLATNDLERVFYQNDAGYVFDRIGTVELLKSAWQRDDLPLRPDEIQKQVDADGTPAAIASVQPQSFYSQRFSKLKDLASALLQSGGLQGSTADLTSFKNQASPSSVDGMKDAANSFESVLATIKPSSTSGQQNLIQARTLIQEVTVGGSLDMPLTSANSGRQPIISAGNAQGSFSCSSTDTLKQLAHTDRATYISNDATRLAALNKQLTGYAQNIADCQISDSLGLPAGTLTTWLGRNDESQNSLAISIGRAQAIADNKPITDAAAQSKGADILAHVSGSLLGSLIPGSNSYDKRYQINTGDIVNLLLGSSSTVLTKIGGKNLDERSNWNSGTALNLASPTCTTGTTVRTCSDSEAQSLRLNSLAQVGLQQLTTDLNLPPGLDITGPGSFNSKYSNALFSNALGLITNSFTGSFQQVVNANEPGAVMAGLGLSDTAAIRAALTLQTAIDGKVASNPNLANPQIDGAILDYINTARLSVLKQVEDGSSAYWSTPNATSATQLGQKDNADYQSFIQKLSNMQGAGSFNDLIKSSTSNLTTDADGYMTIISGLQARSTGLESQFGIGGGSIKKLVTGALKTEDFARPATQFDLGKTLSSQTLPDSIQVLSGQIAKITGCSLYQYLEGGGITKDCQMRTGMGDTTDLLKDPLGSNGLYEGLARTWGTSLENQLQLPQGTIMNLAMNPSQAPEIIISQGLQKVASQMFSVEPGDSALSQNLKAAFGSAFLALACDPQTRACSFNFNTVGSKDVLVKGLNAVIDSELQTFGKETFGIPISRSDIQAILSGDMRTLSYIGVQELLATVNKGLGKLGDLQKIGTYILDYQTLRHGLDSGMFTTAELENAGKQAILAYLGKNIPGNKCLTSTDQSACIGDLTKDAGIGGLISMVGKVGKDDYVRGKIQTDQTDLRYTVLNSLLFSKDQNIPANFVKTVLSGSDAERINMIAQYGINAVLKDGLGGVMNASEIGMIQNFAKGDFKDAKLAIQNAGIGAINLAFAKVDAWLQGSLEGALGVKLPPQFMESFGSWASSGFSKDVYENGSGNLDPTTGKPVPSLGSMVDQVGKAKLFALGDSTLGFKPGTSEKIYGAYKAVKAATSDATKAQKAEATAYLVSLAVTTIASDQLRSIENSLGLVPGSMDLLVQAAVYAIFFPPAAPIYLLQFVLVNMFGVYKVEIEIRATSDGYWPLGGPHPSEVGLADSDLALGDFDAKQTATYQAGIRKAAQEKVHGLLTDLTQMPAKWGGVTLTPAKKLWIAQTFTHPAGDLGSLDGILSANAPWQSPPGLGYGSLSDRTTGQGVQTKDGYAYYVPQTTFRSGFFIDSTFWDHIHIRW